MRQSSAEKLSVYLAQLPLRAQAMLMREFEQAIERGDDAAVADFVLAELRRIVRASDEDIRPRTDNPARLVFRPLDAFLADKSVASVPGQVRRGSLNPIWQWLGRIGAPDEVSAFTGALKQARLAPDEIDKAVRILQLAAAEAIASATAASATPEQRRGIGQIGSVTAVEDLAPIGAVLGAADALDALGARLPGNIRAFGDPQIASIRAALNQSALQAPRLVPFTLAIVMQRLAAPWQIIRLAIKNAASDDAARVAATPFGVAVTMAIQALAGVAATLRDDIKRGQFARVGEYLKTLHDGVRGLRTEIDIRNESEWGRQLTALRVEISNSLQFEIDSVPGRVRRLLRQRPDRDVTIDTRLDPAEIEQTAALIDFVAVCRTFASELAINELTLRTYSDLQHYVEHATESLVESLRHCDPGVRGFREQQIQAAIRFCDVLFGHDYAVLMTRAADNALADERKPVRAG